MRRTLSSSLRRIRSTTSEINGAAGSVSSHNHRTLNNANVSSASRCLSGFFNASSIEQRRSDGRNAAPYSELQQKRSMSSFFASTSSQKVSLFRSISTSSSSFDEDDSSSSNNNKMASILTSIFKIKPLIRLHLLITNSRPSNNSILRMLLLCTHSNNSLRLILSQAITRKLEPILKLSCLLTSETLSAQLKSLILLPCKDMTVVEVLLQANRCLQVLIMLNRLTSSPVLNNITKTSTSNNNHTQLNNFSNNRHLFTQASSLLNNSSRLRFLST